MNTNAKLRTVAEALVDWPADGELPDHIREALDAALSQHRQHTSP